MDMKTFYNWKEEPFTGKWNGKPYTVEGQQSILVEDFVANALAKQLTETITQGECLVSDPKFLNLMEKCFVEPEISSTLEQIDSIVEEQVEEPIEEPKKKGRKAKVAKDAENFEGLK